MARPLEEFSIDLPAEPEALAELTPGAIVFLNGVVYTAREGVYEGVLNGDKTLPDNLACLLYTSPSPRDS